MLKVAAREPDPRKLRDARLRADRLSRRSPLDTRGAPPDRAQQSGRSQDADERVGASNRIVSKQSRHQFTVIRNVAINGFVGNRIAGARGVTDVLNARVRGRLSQSDPKQENDCRSLN
jgi:hypothetical protein